MAITTVKGAVTRTFYNGKGAEVTESYTLQGKEWKKRWTAWFEAPHNLIEGDQVEVSGMHGDEIDEWEKDGEKRQSVKRSLNKARIVSQQLPAEPSQPPSASQGGEWAQTPASEELPF